MGHRSSSRTGVILWAQVVSTYIAVNGARLHVPERVGILEVRIPRPPSGDSRAIGGPGPGREPQFHPHSGVQHHLLAVHGRPVGHRSFWQKVDDIEVGRGGFHDELGGFVVPAHGVREL